MTLHEISKKELHEQLKQGSPQVSYYKTEAGFLKLYAVGGSIYKTELINTIPTDSIIKDLDSYKKFVISGTKLQINTWKALYTLPKGKTVSYSDLAKHINYPKAHRAVATAVGNNPIGYFIPCHRVIRKNGDLGGYAWGIEVKRELLKSEGIDLD